MLQRAPASNLFAFGRNFATQAKPSVRPHCPNFGSGPTAKRPGYSLSALPSRFLGRSHRHKDCHALINKLVEDSRKVLGIPKDYRIGIVPASDTGAFEMAMWSMLGPRHVDVCYWEAFGKGWMTDVTTQLKLPATVHKAPYGSLPDLTQTKSNNDILFPWNGTTSGVRVPNADWISSSREGLTFCDATSAIFAMDLPWEKLDVTTYSWQKALGGEAAHGMLILSPRAAQRLKENRPAWPMPKVFRMTDSKGNLDEGIWEGKVINTVSMLCVEDFVDALEWAQSVGGLPALIKRSQNNLAELEKFAKTRKWIGFLAADPKIRSSTSICMTVDLPQPKLKAMIALLEKEGVAKDIAMYRDAPDGLRIWGGPTVETSDITALTHWLDWAYDSVRAT